MKPPKKIMASSNQLFYMLAAITYCFMAFSCKESQNSNNIISFIDSLRTPTDSLTKYFPEKDKLKDTAFNNNALRPYIARWYSYMLFALHEPVLDNYKGNHEVYRFTWLRSFHNPLSFRLEKKENIILLFVKKCDGAGGYKPGKIILDTTISVTEGEWDTFTKRVDKIAFWQLPLDVNDVGADGAQWILEGIRNNQYHAVSRFSPTEKSSLDYKQCCEYLLTLSRIKIPDGEIY